MPDKYRYVYGETNPRIIAFKTGFPVSIGDMCFQDPADSVILQPSGLTAQPVKSASSMAWQATFGATQVLFAQYFLGINSQRWDGTNLVTGSKDGYNRVSTAGVFLMDCAAGSTFNIDDLVGPDNSGSSTLMPQQVAKVGALAGAIGRVEKAVQNSSSVLVRILPLRLAMAVI